MLRRPSGVAVLSPTESGGCSGSDITEPRSPRSPESACSTADDSAGARMPPWASDPAPPAPRRLAAQPAPVRRPNPPVHRRITEYFNHKMKPQNGLKRDHNGVANDESKRKCLPKNGVTHDLEKYISYLSQTLTPKVLMEVGKQTEVVRKVPATTSNIPLNVIKPTDFSTLPKTSNMNLNNMSNIGRSKDISEKNHITMNGFVELRQSSDSLSKDKPSGMHVNGLVTGKKTGHEVRIAPDPSSKWSTNNQQPTETKKRKLPLPMSSELIGVKILSPPVPYKPSPKKQPSVSTAEALKTNGVVSSTMLDCRMNGVTCGSNNLSLNRVTPKPSPVRRETAKKSTQPSKRTNRKSSACIANSKNLTWSKANNLKQVQLQNQNCVNSTQTSPVKHSMPSDPNPPSNMSVPNGVRQVSMTLNGGLGSLNVPVNCHQMNIQQPCNGTVTSNNLASFVTVPHNVMLTTLRIPQNGLPAQTLGQPNNMTAFGRPNVNVPSPTKINGQFMFPLVQNINGTVVQIPSLLAKMPNFVLPQTPQRQDHLQNQQTPHFLINGGTLLKLTNTMNSSYANVNKPPPATSQSIPVMNKNLPGMQAVGMTVQPKPNYTVNLSHPVLMPQPGYIVTSMPNINVKETWSYTGTNTASSSQSSCSNPISNHPPIVANFSTQALHTSSIPIAPVKPPDNPIQGTDPPSSTVTETDIFETSNTRCDIPWLSKTVNYNIIPLDTNKISSRPFAKVSSLSEKLEELAAEKMREEKCDKIKQETIESTGLDLRKVEEVARREDTIFTQITVLKDVSSNVHNSVIEANFCSATTESESGIGTDKSIDSPSDSQTSKECDEDSTLSLSVSVCSVEVQSQKSPILKQPKTLRFPPKTLTKPNGDQRKSSTDTTSTVIVCLWEDCKREFDSDPDLLEHLQNVHVETQAGKENYVCLWGQCKVRGKPSCSRLWLERHALSHGGNKPFKCIVDGCERRFSNQTLLERHVNNHFNETSPNAGGSKKTSESGSKLIRRNGKKLRYRRQPWSARMFDFFDAGMMEGLAWRLLRSTGWRLGGACPLREPPGRHTLALHAALAATRYNAAARRREALLTYYPPHVLEDEWVPEKDVKRIKRVEIAQLPVHTKVILYEQFCASYRKTPSPPPVKKPPQIQAPPQRLLPPRNCTSSRLLNNLIAKQKRNMEVKIECNATNVPMIYTEEDRSDRVEVTGAKKRKLGRRYGGNAFWPCGR